MAPRIHYRALCAACLATLPVPIANAEPRLAATTTVFSAGVGYANYRIPSLTVALDGTLLAIAEGRSGDDPGLGGDIDLVSRRSTDGGATWSPMQVIDNWASGTVSNPTTVLDRTTGRVFLLYNRWEGDRGSTDSMPGTTHNTAWVRYSDDAGQTWSVASDITMSVKDFYKWNTVAFGPGSGIQASNGRLIIPAARGNPGWNSYAVYSSDHGNTWTRGALVPGGNLSNENQLVQLADGRILMDARPYTGGTGPRAVTTSSNGGMTWSAISPGQVSPDSEAAIERFTLQSAGDDRNRIVFTGPKGPDRYDLVIRTSYDETQSWGNERLLHDGYSGYSDISIMQDRSIGVLFETNQARSISFTKLNREWIEPPQGLKALEGFRYNTITLGTKNGGIHWTGGWSGAADLSGEPAARIESSDLHYTNFPFTIEGKRRMFLSYGSGGRAARALPTPINLDSSQPSYLSLLVRQDAVGSTETESALEALDISLLSGTIKQIAFGVQGDESFYFDLPGRSGKTQADALSKGTVYYLVAKIVPQDGASSANLDQIYLKAFRSGDTVPATEEGIDWTLAGTSGVNSAAVIDRIVIKGGSLTDWLVDELRIGTTFGAVVSNVLQYKWNVNAGGLWTTASNWLDGVPGNGSQTAEFTDAITTPQTITLAGVQTVGGIVFDNVARYTIAGGSADALLLDAAAGPGTISVISGSHIIGSRIVLGDDAIVTVAADSALTLAGPLTATGKGITKQGAGIVELGSLRARSLEVAGGTVRLTARPQSNDPSGTSVVTALAIAADAQLNLGNNSMVIDYTGPAGGLIDDIRQHLRDKRLIGDSSDSDKRLGYGDSAVLSVSSFAGQPVDPTAVLISHTFGGDANLDGTVNVADLGALATSWQQSGFWTAGDFDYNGKIDVGDLGILASNWQQGVTTPTPGPGFSEALAALGLPQVAVPEPASAAVLSLSLAGLIGRRRRA